MAKIDDLKDTEGIDIILLLKIRAAHERDMIRNDYSLSFIEQLHRIAQVNKKYSNLIFIQMAKHEDVITQSRELFPCLIQRANQLHYSIIRLQGDN